MADEHKEDAAPEEEPVLDQNEQQADAGGAEEAASVSDAEQGEAQNKEKAAAVSEEESSGGTDGDSAGPDSGDSEEREAMSEEDAEAAMLAMLENDDQKADGDADEFPDLSAVRQEERTANPAEFQQLSPSGTRPEPRNIELLLDVKMPVSIELGRTQMPISEILGLGPGAVVELSKLAGEPVDILVNQKIIARGEVVVVDENFGVRITQLMSPEERLKYLAQQ